MNPVAVARTLVVAAVVGAFISFAGGVVVETKSNAAPTAPATTLKAQAIYFQQARSASRRDLAVSSMAARSQRQSSLWSGFMNKWSTINHSMKMNSTVPKGLPSKGHVFVILGSALTKSGKVGAKFERRLELARKALKKYSKSKALVTGGVPKKGRTEAEAGAAWLIARGIPSSRIMKEKKASSTIGNAKNSMAILAKSRAHSSYSLISDSSHLRRASILFEAAAVLVQENSGKTLNLTRRSNLAHMDMKKAGKVPLADWSVKNTAGEVATLFGIHKTYKKLLAKAPGKPVLTSLKLTAPAKLTYRAGEKLSAKGFGARALYNEGAFSKDVTKGAKVGGFTTAKVGKRAVTVTYAEGGSKKSATFGYTVVKAAGVVQAGLSTTKVKRAKTRVTMKVKVRAGAVSPTGRVRFYLDGVRQKTVTLTGSRAKYTFGKIRKPGRHVLKVKYLGNSRIAAASKSVTVKVRKLRWAYSGAALCAVRNTCRGPRPISRRDQEPQEWVSDPNGDFPAAWALGKVRLRTIPPRAFLCRVSPTQRTASDVYGRGWCRLSRLEKERCDTPFATELLSRWECARCRH